MDLQLTPKQLPSINGNFETYKADLVKQIEGYKAMPLTEETVAPVKSAIRSIRTTLEKIETTAVSAYFESPKKVLKAQFAELYTIIAEGEDKVDAIIMEDTRKRNESTTIRLQNYITSKAASMALDKDVIDFVKLEKQFYNKSQKEADSLDAVDNQLVTLEKNFAAYNRAVKKIEKLAKEIGPTFNKQRFMYALSKYGDNNDSTASLAEEEVDRLKAVVPEEARPVPVPVPVTAPSATRQYESPEGLDGVVVSVGFPLFDKKKSKGSDDLSFTFSVPKELKKSFTELLKELKEAGIKSSKL